MWQQLVTEAMEMSGMESTCFECQKNSYHESLKHTSELENRSIYRDRMKDLSGLYNLAKVTMRMESWLDIKSCLLRPGECEGS